MGDKIIQLYISSVTGNANMRKHQQHIEDILTTRNVNFEKIDISIPNNEDKKQFMRENARPPPNGKTPLPPQLFAGDEYLGDYDKFYEAVEDNEVDVFLKLATKTEVSQAEVEVTGGKSDD